MRRLIDEGDQIEYQRLRDDAEVLPLGQTDAELARSRTEDDEEPARRELLSHRIESDDLVNPGRQRERDRPETGQVGLELRDRNADVVEDLEARAGDRHVGIDLAQLDGEHVVGEDRLRNEADEDLRLLRSHAVVAPAAASASAEGAEQDQEDQGVEAHQMAPLS